jgi:hypothetical protein
VGIPGVEMSIVTCPACPGGKLKSLSRQPQLLCCTPVRRNRLWYRRVNNQQIVLSSLGDFISGVMGGTVWTAWEVAACAVANFLSKNLDGSFSPSSVWQYQTLKERNLEADSSYRMMNICSGLASVLDHCFSLNMSLTIRKRQPTYLPSSSTQGR